MEDKQPEQKSTSIPVMDIQPPKPDTTPGERPEMPDQPVEAPAPDTVSEIDQPSTDEASVVSTADSPAEPGESPAEEAQPGKSPLAIEAAPLPKKHGAPIGVILTAVVVMTGLAGLTVFAYIKTQQPVKTAENTQVTQQTQTPKVQAAEVEDLTKGIDESMKTIDDAADFSANDLSDNTLGL